VDWIWPDALRLLGLLPVLIVLYIGILRWRCRFAIRYSSLSLVDSSSVQRSFIRKHLPFLLFIGALASLLISLARPLTAESLLSGRTTIMLTLDVSRSMCMRDIQPNRLEVAKEAALSFIQHPVMGTQAGIVAFSGFAELAQEPTTDLRLLEYAIVNLTTATRTAIGSAILRSLDAIAEVDKRVASSEEIPEQAEVSMEQLRVPRLAKDGYLPHVIVLLTDGESNTGPSPLLAAQQAAERGVRIYPIGFGTTKNAVMDCWNLTGDTSMGSPVYDPSSTGGSFGSGPDEATLRQIAEITGGEFYTATSAADLQLVFDELHTYIAMTNRTIEISAYFAAVGAMLAIIAFFLSTLWHPLL
jgi:Ca-activated chloride channel family protein